MRRRPQRAKDRLVILQHGQDHDPQMRIGRDDPLGDRGAHGLAHAARLDLADYEVVEAGDLLTDFLNLPRFQELIVITPMSWVLVSAFYHKFVDGD